MHASLLFTSAGLLVLGLAVASTPAPGHASTTVTVPVKHHVTRVVDGKGGLELQPARAHRRRPDVRRPDAHIELRHPRGESISC